MDQSGGFLNRRPVVRIHPDAPKYHRIALAEARAAMRPEIGHHSQAAREWRRVLVRAKREGRRLLGLLDKIDGLAEKRGVGLQTP